MIRALIMVATAAGLLFAMGGGRVASAANWDQDDGCRTGISADGYFVAAGDATKWTVVEDAGGWGDCYMWMASKDDIPKAAWAIWDLPRYSSSYNRTYNLHSYVDSDLTIRPNQAHYRAHCCGGAVTKHYYLNQNTNHTSFCYQLVDNNGAGASLFMEGTAGGYVDLIDVTSTSGRKVIVDLFCYREA